jgi:hypothetical protein
MADEGRCDSPLSFFVVSRGTEARAPAPTRARREDSRRIRRAIAWRDGRSGCGRPRHLPRRNIADRPRRLTVAVAGTVRAVLVAGMETSLLKRHHGGALVTHLTAVLR